MAAQKTRDSGADKRRKSRKRKARTEVSSSSESDSEAELKSVSPSPVTEPSTRKDQKKRTAIPQAATEQVNNHDSDFHMKDEPTLYTSSKVSVTKSDDKSTSENFGAIYLRRVAAEVADDLDKVREAQDFKASSVPMLIHALRQGESLFDLEEKRRFVGAATGL